MHTILDGRKDGRTELPYGQLIRKLLKQRVIVLLQEYYLNINRGNRNGT